MRLEALHLVERTEMGILVVQPDDEADRDLIVVHVVEEGAAVSLAVQRPADGVQHQSGFVLGRLDLPQFLDAQAKGLRIGAVPQVETLEQRLGQRAPATLGENRVGRAELNPRLIVLRRLTIAANSHVTGGHAHHPAGRIVQHLGGGETWVDLYSELFGLLRQPAADVAEADDVVALVVHLRRRRQPERLLLGEEQEVVFGRRNVERRALVPPVGNQFVERARLDDRARQDMRADLGPLLDNADADLSLLPRGQLLQPDCRAQPGWPATDDDNVELHRFAGHGISPHRLRSFTRRAL